MRRKLLVFTLLCLVSLFADVTYEGARSVIGPYLELVGASSLIAGLAVVGDVLGYCARLLSGVAAYRFSSSRFLWRTTLVGYLANLLSVPPLAFVKSWWQIIALVFVERIGKGLRTPTRDTILAEVAEGMGRGRGFGLHEVADQVGAVAGPIVVATLSSIAGLRTAFLALAIPAAISISLVLTAWRLYPRVESVERMAMEGSVERWGAALRGLGKGFIKLVAATAALGLGFIPWTVVSYVETAVGFSPSLVALAYAVAMGVDAAVALPMGWLYDRVGPRVMALGSVVCVAIPIALGVKSLVSLFIAATAWGIAMGILESAFRAAVADLVEPRLRPLAYGVAYFVFGLSWLVCGVYSGLLAETRPTILVATAATFLAISTAIYASMGGARRGYVHR